LFVVAISSTKNDLELSKTFLMLRVGSQIGKVSGLSGLDVREAVDSPDTGRDLLA
jgi:hypothetical protein